MEQIIIMSATISVLIFGIIGIIDGFYYHLWKFKLHKHSETRFEHWIHTIRAAAFLALLYLLFLNDFGGKYLLIALGIVLLDIVILVIDLVAEKDSRENLGGLPHNEYIVHVIANALHYIALALILVAKPLSSWELNASHLIEREFPSFTEMVAINLIPGVILMVVFHLLLMNKKVALLFDNLQEKVMKK
jgi:uncharacterized membrane protein HdeD (DUF308 family)